MTTQHRKIFLDCGTNIGQGFRQFIKAGKIVNDTEIHCFEPNPFCEIDVTRLKAIAIEEGLASCNKIFFYQTAILDRDGVSSIFVRDDEKNHVATCLQNIGNSETQRFQKIGGVDVEVTTTRLTKFIDDLQLTTGDELIIKIDIEGSEFLVLLDMCENFKHWHVLKDIFVEWHERFISHFDPHSARSYIEKVFRDNSVEITPWF
jgi:FkbM family methyltransferase